MKLKQCYFLKSLLIIFVSTVTIYNFIIRNHKQPWRVTSFTVHPGAGRLVFAGRTDWIRGYVPGGDAGCTRKKTAWYYHPCLY